MKTLRGRRSPAKDRGCACAHGGDGPDAAISPTPGRERERETERERERKRERERQSPPKPQDHSGPDISKPLRFTAMVGTVPPSSQKRSAGRTTFPNLGKSVTRGDRDCNFHLRPLPRPLTRLARRRPAGRTPLPNLGKFVTKGDRDCNLHLRPLPRGKALPALTRLPRRRAAGRTALPNLGKFVTRGDEIVTAIFTWETTRRKNTNSTASS